MLHLARRALAVVLLFLCAGCQVTLTAGIDARSDGTGVVRAGIGLDGEALATLGDPATELRLDDLRQAGWEVVGPQKEKDGLTWVRLARPFSTPAEAGEVAASLSGPDGPFRDFRLARKRSFLKTTTVFSGLVDLSRGLAGLNDPDVQRLLGDADLGLEPARLAGQVTVRVEARLPGDIESNGVRSGSGAVAWEPEVGQELRLEAKSEKWNLVPLLPALAALVFATAALVLVVSGRRRRQERWM